MLFVTSCHTHPGVFHELLVKGPCWDLASAHLTIQTRHRGWTMTLDASG